MSTLGLELVLYGALPTSASFVTMISWCFPFLPSPRLATKKCSTNVAMFIDFCDVVQRSPHRPPRKWAPIIDPVHGSHLSICNKEPPKGTKLYFP